jgi:hypothetical protein
VKDHFIPHIVEKMTSKGIYDTLVGLFQSTCVSRQILLRSKLSVVCMSKIDVVVRYLTKLTKLKD